MYQTLKKLVPRSLKQSFKPQLRRLLSVFYAGHAFNCNTCQFKMRQFIKLSTGDLLCPRCGSLGRTRRLWQYLEKEIKAEQRVLHFSPPNILRHKLSSLENIEYITSDFAQEFEADKCYNIEDIDENDNSYDLIICYHVLEHVENDSKAMSELHRIIRPGGKCIIQTPFKEGDIYEDKTITTPTQRLKHYGQADHLRIYSVEGLIKRLKDVSFNVERLDFLEMSKNPHGFKVEESILVALKGKSYLGKTKTS